MHKAKKCENMSNMFKCVGFDNRDDSVCAITA